MVYDIKVEDTQRLENNFTYHSPIGDQAQRYTDLRQAVKAIAISMMQNCPPSRELSLALTKLEEAVFWANAAIARNEKDVPSAA